MLTDEEKQLIREMTEEQKQAIRMIVKITKEYDPNSDRESLRHYLASFKTFDDALYHIRIGEGWVLVWCLDVRRDCVYCVFSGRTKTTDRSALYSSTHEMLNYFEEHASTFEADVNSAYSYAYSTNFLRARNYRIEEYDLGIPQHPVFGRYIALRCTKPTELCCPRLPADPRSASGDLRPPADPRPEEER